MKKMFAASLVAIMAVSAANAEIASVSYTENAIETKTGDISTLATSTKTNLTAAVNELVGMVGEQNVGTQVSAAVTQAKAYTDALANGAVKANTDAIAGMDLATTGGEGSFIQQVAQADGTVTATPMTFETIVDNTTKNSVIAPTTKAIQAYVDTQINAIDGKNSNVSSRVETLEGWQTTAQNAIDGLTAKDTQLEGAIASGDTATLNSAKAYADAEDAKIESKIGTVAEGETVVGMIADAQTQADKGVADAAAAKAAADAAQADADANATAISNLGETYATDAELNTAKSDIKTAYEAADASLKTELEGQISAASGSAADVADDLAEYIQSNNTAVAAAKTQADKGVADAAAAKTQADKGVADAATAKAAADAAQADADANAAAIEGLDTTYVSESEMTTFKTSNTSAIATAKSEAIAAAKSAGDAAYDAKGAAAAAQTAAVNAAKTAADATYQVKSSALSVGAANGAWTDLTKATGYSTTGTHSLVLKNGTIQWEAVRYAE